jgi:hypothetical protein
MHAMQEAPELVVRAPARLATQHRPGATEGKAGVIWPGNTPALSFAAPTHGGLAGTYRPTGPRQIPLYMRSGP